MTAPYCRSRRAELEPDLEPDEEYEPVPDLLSEPEEEYEPLPLLDSDLDLDNNFLLSDLRTRSSLEFLLFDSDLLSNEFD